MANIFFNIETVGNKTVEYINNFEEFHFYIKNDPEIIF